MDQQPQLSEEGVVRTAQIISGALIAGVLFFAGIAFVNGHGRPPGDPFLAYFAIVFTAGCIIASFIVPGIVAKQTLKQLSSDKSDNKYYGAFQTQLIIRQAILEGPGFLCCIAYMTTRIWWTFGVVLLLVALMAASFPTKGRVSDWVRERRELDSLDQN
jgi:hypothetical protein